MVVVVVVVVVILGFDTVVVICFRWMTGIDAVAEASAIYSESLI